MKGIVLIKQNRNEAGLTKLGEGIEMWKATKARVGLTRWLSYLAEGYLSLGQLRRAAEAVELALNTQRNTCERFYLSELMRLKAEIMAEGQDNDPSTVRAMHADAVAIANEQHAISIKVRATLSYARYLKHCGEGELAISLLASAYSECDRSIATKDANLAEAFLSDTT